MITCSRIFSFAKEWGGGGNRSEKYSMYMSSLSAGVKLTKSDSKLNSLKIR